MYDEVIQKILKYEEEFLFEPGPHWPKQEIRKRSYARWASEEIILSIMNRPFVEPDMIVEEFIIKMEYFLHISENTTTNSIFTIAESTAEDILGLIL